MKLVIFALSLLTSLSLHAQMAPDIIKYHLNGDTFQTGEKAVLSVFKVAGPHNPEIGVSVEALLRAPDGSSSQLNIQKITPDVFMALTNPLEQNGNYSIDLKAFLEDGRVISPLRARLQTINDRICELEILLARETDPAIRSTLEKEKAKLEVEILIANAQIAESRRLVQESNLTFSVSGNKAPRFLGSSTRLKALFTDIVQQNADHVTIEICTTFPVLDPEDGEDYNWEIDFGDGNQITFSNLSYNTHGLGIPRNFGCISHSYFGNQRPKVTYKAVDKEGAALIVSETLDIRTNVQGPRPKLKVTDVKKVTVTNENGEESPAVEVSFNPSGSKIPTNSGIYYYRFFPQGRCGDFKRCPDFYFQDVPFKEFKHTYKLAGTFWSQFLVRDNLQNTKTVINRLQIDPSQVPTEPSKTYIDSLFGPSAIIQADSSSVTISDTNTGAVVNFDGTGSFDYSGDDSKLSYHWDFGDNFSGHNFSTDKKTTHVFKHPGNYYVSLYVKDEDGNSSVADWMHIRVTDKKVEIAPPSVFAFHWGNPQEVMFTLTPYRKLTATANSQFYWDFGDGTGEVSIGAESPTKLYENPGVYEVSVTFQDMEGKFVTAKKTIDTANTDVIPELGEGIRVHPWDFSQVNQNVTVDGSSPTHEMHNYQYFWHFQEGMFALGGPEEGTQNIRYQGRGIKEISLALTNPGGFSSEFMNVLPVADKRLEISDPVLTVENGNTKVDFLVLSPTAPSEIKRVEIFNYWGDPAIIEGPQDDLSISGIVEGVRRHNTIVLTDTAGNQNIFFKEIPDAPIPQSRNDNLPVSDELKHYIDHSNQYGKHLRKQNSL